SQQGSRAIDYFVTEPVSSAITNIATITGTSSWPQQIVSSPSSLTTHIILGSVTVYNADGSFLRTYLTIQAGINACPNGGTVSASAGIYTEVVNINKRIALIGAGATQT
ncbi:MAG: hypothetical protein AAB296_04385, partial [Candidatus Desantisbacteria bacterium]